MNKIRFFFDLDGTMNEWVEATDEELLEKGFYLNGVPSRKLIAAAEELAKRYELFVLSAYVAENPYAVEEKTLWCERYLSFIKPENRLFIPCEADKTSAVPDGISETDILVDDYSVNLHAWRRAGGTGVKYMNGANGSKGTWDGYRISCCDTVEDMVCFLESVAEGIGISVE